MTTEPDRDRPTESAAKAEPGAKAAPGRHRDQTESATSTTPASPATGSTGPGRQRGLGQLFLDEVWSTKPLTVTVLAFVLALFVGAILIIVSDESVRATYTYFFARPGTALTASWDAVSEAYGNLFKGAVVDPAAVTGWLNGDNNWQLALSPISETMTYTAPLIFTGLAVALAFRGGLFNIGAEGQVIMGAIAAGLIGFGLDLPPVIAVLFALIAAMIGGAAWGFVPGFLKARTGAHEVITTIMLNYIALYFLQWLINRNGVKDPGRTDSISKKVESDAQLPHLLGNDLRVHAGILLAVLFAGLIAWLLNRSTFGFELRAVGLNPDAARTAGMSVNRTYTLAMAFAGALAGLGGANLLLGPALALTPQVSGNVGFDGITVALLGRTKPWGVVLAGLLFGALRAGANRMQSYAGIPVDLATVIQALVVIFIAAPALVRAIFRLRAARAGRLEANLAKGW